MKGLAAVILTEYWSRKAPVSRKAAIIVFLSGRSGARAVFCLDLEAR